MATANSFVGRRDGCPLVSHHRAVQDRKTGISGGTIDAITDKVRLRKRRRTESRKIYTASSLDLDSALVQGPISMAGRQMMNHKLEVLLLIGKLKLGGRVYL